MNYTLPDLPYDYWALEPHISGQIIELHHDKHHNAYVRDANATLEKLAEARTEDDYGAIVGWKNLGVQRVRSRAALDLLAEHDAGGRRRPRPRRPTLRAIAGEFKSFEAFKSQLSHVTTTVQGSGWGTLAWDPLGRRLADPAKI